MTGELVILLAVCISVAAFVGGVVALAFSRLWEAKRWERLLSPIHTDLDDLHDQFQHWTRRERVRKFRSTEETESAPQPAGLQRALMRARERGSRGILLKDQEGS